MRQSLLDEYQDRRVTHAWARYITDDIHGQFNAREGLVWPSSKNGQTIYAVYQAARASLKVKAVQSLHTAALLSQVMAIALRYKILIEDI